MLDHTTNTKTFGTDEEGRVMMPFTALAIPHPGDMYHQAGLPYKLEQLEVCSNLHRPYGNYSGSQGSPKLMDALA